MNLSQGYRYIVWDLNINNGRPSIKGTTYEASFIIEFFFSTDTFEEGHALLVTRYKFSESEISEAIRLFKYDCFLSKDFD